MKVWGWASLTRLLVEECHTVMPFSNTPLHTRMKARRSRWAGFMLAWILKMKPVNFSSAGSMGPTSSATRGVGDLV